MALASKLASSNSGLRAAYAPHARVLRLKIGTDGVHERHNQSEDELIQECLNGHGFIPMRSLERTGYIMTYGVSASSAEELAITEVARLLKGVASLYSLGKLA
jgi:hypothetical protein